MAVIYEVLQKQNKDGSPSGIWNYVSYSDESSSPIFTRILDKNYSSQEEGYACPEARDAIDKLLGHGKYHPDYKANVELAQTVEGFIDTVNAVTEFLGGSEHEDQLRKLGLFLEDLHQSVDEQLNGILGNDRSK